MSILDRFRLDGRVAIVSGASSGLGVTFAKSLAEAGALVIVGARRLDRLHVTVEAIEAIGGKATAVQADIRSPENCDNLVQRAMQDFGRVDILVNNAGIGTAIPAIRESPAEFREVIETNLNGLFWLSQACARVMKPGSSVVNISSHSALTTTGLPMAAYAASKAGILGLTRDLAQQWTPRLGIRVNAIAPGFFTTDMTSQLPKAFVDQQMSRIPIGRMGDPVELATALVFLASDAASYVTGQTFVIDGGITCSPR